MTWTMIKLFPYLHKDLITCPILSCGRTSKKEHRLGQEHLQFLLERKEDLFQLLGPVHINRVSSALFLNAT